MAFACCNASHGSARLAFLRAVCAVTEGAAAVAPAVPDAAAAVAAALDDHRVCVLGGRPDLPRSLASVYVAFVVRFLGGLRGVPTHIIQLQEATLKISIAVTHDGSVLIVSALSSNSIYAFSSADGRLLHSVGGRGSGMLQFDGPICVRVAEDDGCVLVADYNNHRIQVLTPQLNFQGCIGDGVLRFPFDMCADDGLIAVCEVVIGRGCISVFKRSNGVLLYRFGSLGYAASQIQIRQPYGLCFVPGRGELAVADFGHTDGLLILVFSIDGVLRRRVDVDAVTGPQCLACTKYDELILLNDERVSVFHTSGELLYTFKITQGSGKDLALRQGVLHVLTETGSCCTYFA